MTWHITIGGFHLAMVESIEVTRSVEQLADTAIITLPGSAYNVALNVENKITRGDAVTIRLGYDNKNITEFTGFLESIKTDGGSIKLNCEDGLFVFRKALKNVELPNAKVTDVINHVIKEVGNYTLVCDYDFSYDKFVIMNTTGYGVLKKIQEEAKPNIYLKGTELHVHPRYSEIFGTANYDFAINIDSEGCDLKYRSETERLYMVTVEGKDSKGKVVKVEEGSTGGDSMTLNISGVSSEASLRLMAKQALSEKMFTGFEGNFTGWLIPYCDSGYKISLYDAQYPLKNGSYYVLEVKIEFTASGGKRVVKLGKRLS